MALRAALAVLCFVGARGFVYDLSFDLVGESSSGGLESGITMSEGPMFATGAAPFGGGASYIDVQWQLSVKAAPQLSGPAHDLNVHVAFLDSATLKAVGTDSVNAQNELERDYCCTAPGTDCGPGVPIGGLIQHPGPSGRRAVVRSWNGVSGGAGGNATSTVAVEGAQWMLAIACDAQGLFPLPTGAMALHASFHNPYGFLPGLYYGMLPWTGTLFVVYLLFAVGYSVLFCTRRKHLIGLQWLVMSVVLISCLEMAVAFGVYDSKNRTGSPTPCNVCPVTPDYLAAVVLAVFKRAFARVLLLAVAKGYGVVHANLPLRVWAGIFTLGLAYLVFSCLNEVDKETSYGLAPTGWELPVVVVDIFGIVYTYGGFADMRKALIASRQTAKAAMYDQLWRVMLLALTIYMLVAGVILGVRLGGLPFPWKSLFFLVHFWDLLYLLVTLAVAWVWRPGPDTAQYAYYASVQQGEEGEVEQGAGPDNADAVAFADTAGIEMTSPSEAGRGSGGGVKGAGRTRGPAPPARGRGADTEGVPPTDAFVIETEEEEEEDGDLSRGGGGGGGGRAQQGGKRGGGAEAQSTRLREHGVGVVDDRPLTTGVAPSAVAAGGAKGQSL